MRKVLPLLTLVLIGYARSVLAHEAKPHNPAELWQAWTFEPGTLTGLVLAAVVYGLGAVRLWRGARFRRAVQLRQTAAYVAGWAALVVALVSPLHALGGV